MTKNVNPTSWNLTVYGDRRYSTNQNPNPDPGGEEVVGEVGPYANFNLATHPIYSIDMNYQDYDIQYNGDGTGTGSSTHHSAGWWDGGAYSRMVPPTVNDLERGIGVRNLWRNATLSIQDLNVRFEWRGGPNMGQLWSGSKFCILHSRRALDGITDAQDRPVMMVSGMTTADNPSYNRANTLSMAPSQGTTQGWGDLPYDDTNMNIGGSLSNYPNGPQAYYWVSNSDSATSFHSKPVFSANEIVTIEIRIVSTVTPEYPRGLIAYRMYRRNGEIYERGIPWDWDPGISVVNAYMFEIQQLGCGQYNTAPTPNADLWMDVGGYITVAHGYDGWLGVRDGFFNSPSPNLEYYGGRDLGNLTPTIYVAPTSQGSGNGSSEANATTLAAALASATPGTIIGALPGNYSKAAGTTNGLTPSWQISANGTAGNYITVVAKYPASLMTDPTTDPNASRLRHTGSFGSGTGGPVVGAYQKSYHRWVGFVADENFAPSATDVATIHYRSSNNCEFRYMRCIATTGNPGFGSDNHSGIGVRNCENINIFDNKVSGYNHSGSHNHNGLVRYDTENLVIRNNEFFNNTTGIYLKDSPGLVGGVNELVQFNNIHDNGTGIELACTNDTAGAHSDVTQNAIIGNGTGVLVANDTEAVRVFNNTIVNDSDSSTEGGCIVANFGGADTSIYNNICVQRGATVLINQRYRSSAAITGDYNRYYSTGGYSFRYNGSNYTSLSAWQSGVSSDANSTSGNPGFADMGNNDFHLNSGSPCLAAGNTGGPIGCYITGNEIMGIRDVA